MVQGVAGCRGRRTRYLSAHILDIMNHRGFNISTKPVIDLFNYLLLLLVWAVALEFIGRTSF